MSMKLKLYKHYIDKLGNISVAKPLFNHLGEKHEKKLILEHIDNIYHKKKMPMIGKTEHVFGFNGKLEGVLEDSPFAPVREFTIFAQWLLWIKRVLKCKKCGFKK